MPAPTVYFVAASVFLVVAASVGAQQTQLAGAVAAPFLVDTGTTAGGLLDGSVDAEKRTVAGRAMVGFLGGLPIGFLGISVLQGDPAGAISLGLGLGIIASAWKLGDAQSPQIQSIHDRGQAYQSAYSKSYRKRLLERRKKAAILGGVAGGVTGFGLLILLLSEIGT